jgi:hypothetical protein
MIILSSLLILTFSILISSSLKITSRPAFILSIYVLAFSNIVITGLSASLVNRLNSQPYFIIVEFVLLFGSLFLWLWSGKPNIFGPWHNNKDIFSQGWWRKSWNNWAVVWGFGIIVVLFYSLGAWLVVNVPQSTHDSMATHLARVGFWLQHGNMLPWPTPNVFNLIYPVNANLVMLWLILFSRSDTLPGFVQWTAALVGALAIFGVSRSLSWNRAQSLFAGLLWLTLPQVLLQSTTTQLDLIIASLFIISIYFFIFGIKEKSSSVLILSGLTLGLTLGTKQITIFALPGLAVFILLVWLKDQRTNLKPILILVLSSLLFTFLFGSYIYFQNIAIFGNPLGDEKTLALQVGGQERGGSLVENLTYNSARLFYQSLDFSGLPPIFTDNLTRLKSRIFKPIFLSIGLDLESGTAITGINRHFSYLDNPPIRETISWFGVLGFLLLLPTAIFHFIVGIRQRDPFRTGLVITAVTYFLAVVAFRPGWTIYQGRYFILAIALIIPLTAWIVRVGQFYKLLDSLVVVISAIIMFNVTTLNLTKPLLSYTHIQEAVSPFLLKIDPQIAEKINSLIKYYFPVEYDIRDTSNSWRKYVPIGMGTTPETLVRNYVPETAVLAIGTTSADFDLFPLFGTHLTRSLYYVDPPEKLQDKNWFRNNGIQYLLINRTDPLMGNPPSWLTPYQHIGNWELYYPNWQHVIE